MIILKSVCWLEIGDVNLDLPYLSLHQFSVNQLLPGSYRNFSRIWSPRMKPWILCVSIPPWPLLRLFLENVNSKRKTKHLKGSAPANPQCSSQSPSRSKLQPTVNYKIYKKLARRTKLHILLLFSLLIQFRLHCFFCEIDNGYIVSHSPWIFLLLKLFTHCKCRTWSGHSKNLYLQLQLKHTYQLGMDFVACVHILFWLRIRTT